MYGRVRRKFSTAKVSVILSFQLNSIEHRRRQCYLHQKSSHRCVDRVTATSTVRSWTSNHHRMLGRDNGMRSMHQRRCPISTLSYLRTAEIAVCHPSRQRYYQKRSWMRSQRVKASPQQSPARLGRTSKSRAKVSRDFFRWQTVFSQWSSRRWESMHLGTNGLLSSWATCRW